jgi:serine protease Do
MIAGVALLAVPSSLLAQKENDKKEKQTQTIIITRTGDTDEKTVIEVDGDKVKINGKDAKDAKDVNVNVNTYKGNKFRSVYGQGQSMTMDFDKHGTSLFEEDENRAMLGVTTEGDDKGAEVRSITQGAAAEKAGLKKGDIITKIGTKKIEDSDDVTKAVRSHKPGDKVVISYLRDGKEQTTTAELGKWKGIKMNAVSIPRVPMAETWGDNFRADVTPYENFGSFHPGGRPRLGLSIQDDEDGKGAKVLEVEDEGAAKKAGLQKDDIITAIDDKEVKGTDDVTKTIRQNREKYTFNFKVLRGGKTQTIEVKMPRKLKQAEL